MLLIVEASLVTEHGLYGMQASVVAVCGLSSCGAQALEPRLNTVAQRLSCSEACGNLPGSQIEHASPALAGGFFTTEPPGKPNLMESYGEITQDAPRV